MQKLLQKWQTWIAIVVGLLTIAGMIFDLPRKIGNTFKKKESSLVLSGIIWDENRDPLAGVSVRLRELGLRDTTDQDGEFKFRVRVPEPRLVKLIATKDEYETVDTDAMLGETDFNFRMRRKPETAAEEEPEKPAEPAPAKEITRDNAAAIIELAKGGRIVMEFYPQDAPNTVDNFIKLAKKGFYDGLTFHRVVPGFIVQGGDPLGTGRGGPGYNIKAEFNSRKHLTGTLAMARSTDPDSAGSQFYICLAPQPGLDGQYTVFGQVIEGMDLVKGIAKGDVMKKVTIVDKATVK